MKKESGAAAGIVIAILVLVGAGIGLYLMTEDSDVDEQPTTSQQESTDETQTEAIAEEDANNIVETAQTTESLSILVDAVVKAELAETLSGEGPFTVLAPDNDAFAAAIDELDTTSEELLAREDLADILSYHVIAADMMTADLLDGMTLTTVQGSTLVVEVTTDGVFFVDENDRRAEVTTADVSTSNGTVHIIDNVLLPGDGSGGSEE